jgi:hypothetical protein
MSRGLSKPIILGSKKRVVISFRVILSGFGAYPLSMMAK